LTQLRLPTSHPSSGLRALALCVLLAACGDTVSGSEPDSSPPSSTDAVAAALAAGFAVDTVGVRNLAEGDTLNLDEGLTIIQTTVRIPEKGEVFAWEFNAQTMNPVKLLIVRWKDSRTRLELIGEGPTVIPGRLGPNKIQLPEPIPVLRGDMMAIYMPEAGTIPFRKIKSWKTLIMPRPLSAHIPAANSSPCMVGDMAQGHSGARWTKPPTDPRLLCLSGSCWPQKMPYIPQG
jgi:hypothetical protein